jgi:hypothetical protein
MSVTVTHSVVAAATSSAPFTSANALTTLLTTESLLFAAFNAGIVLTVPTATVRQITPGQAYALARGCVAVLALVAIAGAVAWCGVFADGWPHSPTRVVEGLGIAVGIAVQPVVAGIVAWSNRPRTPRRA